MSISLRHLVYIFIVVIIIAAVLVVGFYYIVQEYESAFPKGKRAVDSLKFLTLVTRHGNRCPLYDLPGNDPYPCSDSTIWPYQEELSIVGRKQLHNLGVKLRSLYNGFLDPKFYNKDVYVSSTTMQRVVESGKCLMAGLYPPSGNQIWNKTLPWQPVPVHQDSVDKTQAKDQCGRFTTLLDEQKTEFRSKWADNITYYNDYVNAALNGSLSSTLGVLTTWDALLSDAVEGYTLPDWASEIFPDAMYPLMNDMYVKYVSASDEMTRLCIGPFFANMMDIVNSKVNGTLTPDRPFYYWSGHDDTLIALQAVVGLSINDIVGVVTPGSAILFEIHKHKKTDDYFVQVLYIDGIGQTKLEPKLLHIPFCNNKTSCDYDTFVTNTAKFANLTESDYDAACSSS